MPTRPLLAATALFTFASSACAAEPELAVCRVTGNTKGPPRVAVAADAEEAAKVPSLPPEERRTVPASTYPPEVVEQLPACDAPPAKPADGA